MSGWKCSIDWLGGEELEARELLTGTPQVDAVAEVAPIRMAASEDRRVDLRLSHRAQDGVELGYRLFLPPGYDSQSHQLYPLVLDLHAWGLNGDDNERQLVISRELIRATETSEYASFMVAPQLPPQLPGSPGPHTVGWEAQGATTWAKEILAGVIEEYPVDTSRVYLTGISNGANAVAKMLSEHPGEFAAGLSLGLNGWGNDQDYREVGRTPLWVFRGEFDTERTSLRSVQDWVAAIRNSAGDVQLTHPPLEHCCWSEIHRGDFGDVIGWLFAQRLNTVHVAGHDRLGASGLKPEGLIAGATVEQSSNQANSLSAELAVDGVLSTVSKTHRRELEDVWWEIDLADDHAEIGTIWFQAAGTLTDGEGAELVALDNADNVLWSQAYAEPGQLAIHADLSQEEWDTRLVDRLRLTKRGTAASTLQIRDMDIRARDIVLAEQTTLVFEVDAAKGAGDRIDGQQLELQSPTLAVDLVAGELALGMEFDLIDFASVSGSFGRLNLPGLGEGLSWDTSMLYADGIIAVSESGPDGDVDGDGAVTFADFQILSATFGHTGLGLVADVDGDGVVAFADFLQLAANFGGQ